MNTIEQFRILIAILDKDPEFETLSAERPATGSQLESKYQKLLHYLEERLGMDPLSEVPRRPLLSIPRLYRRLMHYGEVLHPVARCESRKASGIHKMAAEVIIHFTSQL